MGRDRAGDRLGAALTRRAACALLAALAVSGCGGSSAPAPAPSPSSVRPSPPSGLVNGSRCAALRVQVQANVATLQLEQAAGHDDQVRQLQAQIAASRTAARAIPGCDVSDLIPR